MKPSDLKLTVREMVLFSILGAMTFSAKYVMSFLPNVEPSSLMVMLYCGCGSAGFSDRSGRYRLC